VRSVVKKIVSDDRIISLKLKEELVSILMMMMMIIIIIIILFINCHWVVTRWQCLFYMYTDTKKKK